MTQARRTHQGQKAFGCPISSRPTAVVMASKDDHRDVHTTVSIRSIEYIKLQAQTKEEQEKWTHIEQCAFQVVK